MKKISKKRSVNKFNAFVILVLTLLSLSNAGLWVYTNTTNKSIEDSWMNSSAQNARNISDPLKSAEYKIVDEDRAQVRFPLSRISLPMNDATMSANVSMGTFVDNPKMLAIDVSHPAIWSAAYAQAAPTKDHHYGKIFEKSECSRISATLRPSDDYDDFDDYETIKLSSGEKLAINKISKDCSDWYKNQNFDKLASETIDSLKQMRTY